MKFLFFCFKHFRAFRAVLFDLLVSTFILIDSVRHGFFFKGVFEGRRVAVVGGGPSMVGSGLGAVVDSYDLVVRINLFSTEGREVDYGFRTDIRFIGCTLLDKHIAFLGSLENNSIVISTAKNKIFLGSQGRSAHFFHRDTPRYALRWIDLFLGKKVSFVRSAKPPRSGLVLVALLLRYSRPSVVTLFGFSREAEEAFLAVDYRSRQVFEHSAARYRDKHCDSSVEVGALLELERAGFVRFEGV